MAPFPLPGEHATGYMHRLAHANGVTPRELRRVLGIGALTPRSGPDKWVRLAGLLGLDEARFAALTWQRTTIGGTRGLVIVGDRFRAGDVQRQRMRTCPACMAERSVVLVEHQVRPVTACTRHGLRLRERCHGCGRPQTTDPNFSPLDCPTCGASGASAPHERAGAAETITSAWFEPGIGTLRLDPFGNMPPGTAAILFERLADIARLTCGNVDRHDGDGDGDEGSAAARRRDAARAWQLVLDPRHAIARMLSAMVAPGIADRRGIDALLDTPAGRLALAPLRGVDGREIRTLRELVAETADEVIGTGGRQVVPGSTAAPPPAITGTASPLRHCGDGDDRRSVDATAHARATLTHGAAMLRLEGVADEKRAAWWIAAGTLPAPAGGGFRGAHDADDVAAVDDALDRLAGPPAPDAVRLADLEPLLTARGAYRKDALIADLLAGRLAFSRPPGERALVGASVSAAALHRRRAEAAIAAWRARDHHAALTPWNRVAAAAWGPDARLTMDECDEAHARGAAARTTYVPPTPGARPQKRWRTADLEALSATKAGACAPGKGKRRPHPRRRKDPGG